VVVKRQYSDQYFINKFMKKIIFGSQLFGSEINEEVSKKMLDIAYDANIRKIDSAERYPFPETNDKYGLTENIIGNWLSQRKINRSKIELSTKITGRNFGEIKKIQSKRLNYKSIIISVNNCLKRLKTNYIDILYLHWPDRFTNNFGRTYYNPDRDPLYIPLEEQLNALYLLEKQGKIKSFGLSNETPWGIMKFLNLDNKKLLSTVQEEYSLVNRNVERSVKEIILREKIDFYCYSPLSGGLLTDKYTNTKNVIKKNNTWRLNKYPQKTHKLKSKERIEILNKIKKFCNYHKLSIMKLSLAFLKNQKFVSGVIIGPKNIKQLDQTIKAWNEKIPKNLTNQLLDKIYRNN
jgi:aryl-alcohol dehydrogenase-like predicted oxidoreductase